jgi:hypothetical protein
MLRISSHPFSVFGNLIFSHLIFGHLLNVMAISSVLAVATSASPVLSVCQRM